MKSTLAAIMPLLFFSISSCKASSANDEKILFTLLKDCKERIENVNAAFSELACSKIGTYDVVIKNQSPQFVTIVLTDGKREIATDFVPLTNELPINYGKAIEWHMDNGLPKYLVFRLAWGTEEKPFEMTERLVLNLVTNDKICSLATVNTKTVKNANQKVRDLIGADFSSVTSCPAVVRNY